ncbi:MAG TPA: hypothetical protein DDX37_06090 [Candidatus Omnitrophica bacterium]|nr:hypothetical protein [Candidatus Omnitrophota bacterium]
MLAEHFRRVLSSDRFLACKAFWGINQVANSINKVFEHGTILAIKISDVNFLVFYQLKILRNTL